MPEISEDELKAFQDAQEKAKALESTNARLLEESKKNKEKAEAAEGKISEAEKAKLEEEGKLNELLLQERKEKAELEEKVKLRTKTAMKEKVRTEVAKVAKDAHDIDMVLRVAEHKELLKLNEDELSVDGVEEYVTKVRETHAYLFGKKKMPEGEGGGKPPGPGEEGHDPNAGKSDEEKFRAELKLVTSRAEQLKVYKKYGKPIDSFMSHR